MTTQNKGQRRARRSDETGYCPTLPTYGLENAVVRAGDSLNAKHGHLTAVGQDDPIETDGRPIGPLEEQYIQILTRIRRDIRRWPPAGGAIYKPEDIVFRLGRELPPCKVCEIAEQDELCAVERWPVEDVDDDGQSGVGGNEELLEW